MVQVLKAHLSCEDLRRRWRRYRGWGIEKESYGHWTNYLLCPFKWKQNWFPPLSLLDYLSFIPKTIVFHNTMLNSSQWWWQLVRLAWGSFLLIVCSPLGFVGIAKLILQENLDILWVISSYFPGNNKYNFVKKRTNTKICAMWFCLYYAVVKSTPRISEKYWNSSDVQASLRVWGSSGCKV